jgi:1-deoxy-D-xylulose-5-phosphate reductoisomerase
MTTAAQESSAGAARQRLCILGSTGSIGCSTLDVLSRHPGRYQVHALTAHSRVVELAEQCLQWRPAVAVVGSAEDAGGRQRDGRHRRRRRAAACMAAARAGKRLLLANKEALVVGGAVLHAGGAPGGATLLPIDSEHSAIFQCLPEDPQRLGARIDHIVLTASGGPFRECDPDTCTA